MFYSHKMIVTAVLGAFLAMPAFAAKEEEKQSSGGSTFMSESTYKRLTWAHEAIEEGNYAKAEQDLLDLANDVKGRDYEYAVTLQTLGYVFISQENWERAGQYMQQALSLNALPPEPTKQLVYTLAQIYFTLGNYARTISMLEDWFKTAENPPPDAYVILANAYASQERYRDAYPHIKTAIQKAEKPREDWYKLALGIMFELERYPEAAATLEIMVANWPDNEVYWKQLSGIYIELGQDAKALATMALAHKRGLITESEDILNLARLYLLNDVPLEAGKILEKALAENAVERTQKNYELLSQAWVQAREYPRGIEALGKAGELADNGELYVRQAQLYMSMANWEGAIRAARNATEKGGLESSKTGQAWLLMGTAAAEMKDFETATNAFNRARRYPETQKSASQWLSFVETERQVTSLN